MGVIVFTSSNVIKCTSVIKLQINCTLLIHKVVCIVQANQFNQEMYIVIKMWVTEAEAWLCFPGLVSQHRSRLRKIKVLPCGLCWPVGSCLSCCMEWLPFCTAFTAESPSGKFAEQLSCNSCKCPGFFHDATSLVSVLFWKTTAWCCFVAFQNQTLRKTL